MFFSRFNARLTPDFHPSSDQLLLDHVALFCCFAECLETICIILNATYVHTACSGMLPYVATRVHPTLSLTKRQPLGVHTAARHIPSKQLRAYHRHTKLHVRSAASPAGAVSWGCPAGLVGQSLWTKASGSQGEKAAEAGGVVGSLDIFRIERHLRAPYPGALVPLQNQLLWNEVFRKGNLSAKPHDEQLPNAYHHTALEHKGDQLTRLIADEVSIYWALQFCENYSMVQKYLNSHNLYPVSSLVRNDHWMVLSKQFAVHEDRSSKKIELLGTKRLADNFEAYVYALYLDQGMEKVYDFLCPIFLKKLYSEAKKVNLPVPPPVLRQTSVLGIKSNPVGRLWERWLARLEHKLLKPAAPTGIYRVDYERFEYPDWHVPCTNGRECTRDDCYFDHDSDIAVRYDDPEITDDAVEVESAKTPNVNAAQVLSSTHFLPSSSESGRTDSDPELSGREKLESGLIYRISGLMDVRISRETKTVLKKLDRMIDEKWTERKQARKAAAMEMMRSLSEGPDGLHAKIQNVVLARVDSVMSKQAKKSRAQEERLYQSLTSRMTNIEGALNIAKAQLAAVKNPDAEPEKEATDKVTKVALPQKANEKLVMAEGAPGSDDIFRAPTRDHVTTAVDGHARDQPNTQYSMYR